MILQSSHAFIYNSKDMYHETENMKQTEMKVPILLRDIFLQLKL